MTLNQNIARAVGAARDAAAEVIAAIEWTRAARNALHRDPNALTPKEIKE